MCSFSSLCLLVFIPLLTHCLCSCVMNVSLWLFLVVSLWLHFKSGEFWRVSTGGSNNHGSWGGAISTHSEIDIEGFFCAGNTADSGGCLVCWNSWTRRGGRGCFLAQVVGVWACVLKGVTEWEVRLKENWIAWNMLSSCLCIDVTHVQHHYNARLPLLR